MQFVNVLRGLTDTSKSRRKRFLRQQATRLHTDIKSQALDPSLYLSGIAEDTLNGRFEQVALHSAMVMRHLRELGEDGQLLAQFLHEAVFDGFDYGLRETGVGDTSISRKVRKLGEHFYGLARGLDTAFAAQSAEEIDKALNAFALRNGLGYKDLRLFSAYLRQIDENLLVDRAEIISQGAIEWPSLPSGGESNLQ